jgi:HK97 gp10 family phage protein
VSPITSNRLPQIAAAAKPFAERAVAQTAFSIEGWAKNAAPVDTGALRGGIAAAKERELTWRVTAHADYAVYVEMGTRNMTAQPYLDPALRQGEKYLTNVLKAIL